MIQLSSIWAVSSTLDEVGHIHGAVAYHKEDLHMEALELELHKVSLKI